MTPPTSRTPVRLGTALAVAAAFLALAPSALAVVPTFAGTLEGPSFAEFHQANLNPMGGGGSTLALDTGRNFEGAQSARATTPGAAGSTKYSRLQWLDMNLVAGDDVTYSAAFFLPPGFKAKMDTYSSLMRWDNYVWGGDNSATSRSGIVLWGDDRARLIVERVGTPGQVILVGPFDLPEGRWFQLSVRQRLSASDGSAINEVTLDGRLVGSSTRANFHGVAVRNIRYGLVATADSQPDALELWLDDVRLGPTDLSSTGAAPTPSRNGRVALSARGAYRIADTPRRLHVDVVGRRVLRLHGRVVAHDGMAWRVRAAAERKARKVTIYRVTRHGWTELARVRTGPRGYFRLRRWIGDGQRTLRFVARTGYRDMRITSRRLVVGFRP